jgi:hypothetical protein
MAPRWYTPTTCAACGHDAQDMDGHLCAGCREERRATEDHPGSCSCDACQRWLAIDLRVLRSVPYAADLALDAEVSL